MGYLDYLFSHQKRAKLITNIKKLELMKKFGEFDGIVVGGVSGYIIGPDFARRFNKKLAYVRKKTEESHSGVVNGDLSFKKYIIIDDLIESGDTILRLKDEILNVSSAVFVGVLLYHSGDYCNDGMERMDVPIINYDRYNEQWVLFGGRKPKTLGHMELL